MSGSRAQKLLDAARFKNRNGQSCQSRTILMQARTQVQQPAARLAPAAKGPAPAPKTSSTQQPCGPYRKSLQTHAPASRLLISEVAKIPVIYKGFEDKVTEWLSSTQTTPGDCVRRKINFSPKDKKNQIANVIPTTTPEERKETEGSSLKAQGQRSHQHPRRQLIFPGKLHVSPVGSTTSSQEGNSSVSINDLEILSTTPVGDHCPSPKRAAVVKPSLLQENVTNVVVSPDIPPSGDNLIDLVLPSPCLQLDVSSTLLPGGRILYTEPVVEILSQAPLVSEVPETMNHDPPNSEIPETLVNEQELTSMKRKCRPRVRGSPVRKRKRNETLWKSNVRKTLKNSGQPYESSRGKQVEGAKMRGPCSCSRNCVHNISQEERKKVFDTFWKLGNHSRQWDFIRANSECKPTKPQAEKPVQKRKVSRNYFFMIGTKKVKICKQMFMRTLGICDSWISSSYNHVNPDKGFTVSPDKRGGHHKHVVQITPAKIETVKEHVQTFPRVPSHYCRKRSKREYLEHKLSIRKMARLYIKWASTKNLPRSAVASIRQYTDIVNSSFNIGFFKPKKDQCSFCYVMKNNPRQVREDRKKLFVDHKENKKKARKLRDKDKAEAMVDKSIVVSSFDLQKQLSCPKSENSAYYYRNKLNVFNFTTFNEITRVGNCYLWHEGIGKKGSNEISSSLLLYIQDLVKMGYRDLRFYSDNCAGQNKNRFLFAMYTWAAVKYSIKITHRYFEPGHTQMTADSIHARIETTTDLEDIYDFEGWVKAIEEAKETIPPYQVKRLNQTSIFSFKDLVKMQNWEVDLNREQMKWKKVREFHVNGLEGNLVRVKYEFDGDFVTMSPNKAGRPVNLKTYQPSLAYTSRFPLKKNTIEDLTWLCDNLHVPLNKQAFIRGVLSGVYPVEEDEVTDLEFETDEEICNGDLDDEEKEREKEDDVENMNEEENDSEDNNVEEKSDSD